MARTVKPAPFGPVFVRYDTRMSYRAEALEADGLDDATGYDEAGAIDDAGFDDSAGVDGYGPDAGRFGLKRLRKLGKGIAKVGRGALKVGKVVVKAHLASLKVAKGAAYKIANNPVLAGALTAAYPPAGAAIALIKAAQTAEARAAAIHAALPTLKRAAQLAKAQARGFDVASDVGALPGTVRSRRLTKAGFAALLRKAPAAAKLARQILAKAAAPEASGDFDAGAISGQVYIVESEDYPVKIATKLTGNGNRWKELRDANRQKPVDPATGNFKTLNPGEKLNVPVSWWPEITKRFPGTGTGSADKSPPIAIPTGSDMGIPGVKTAPPTGGGGSSYPIPPVVPGLPTGTTTSGGFSQGTILQTQMLLKGWATDQPSAVSPSDFGAAVSDFTGVWDTRTSRACASYQTWANAKAGGKLRVDGQLDQATYDSLVVYASSHIGGYTPPSANNTSTGPTGSDMVVPILPGLPIGTIPGTWPADNNSGTGMDKGNGTFGDKTPGPGGTGMDKGLPPGLPWTPTDDDKAQNQKTANNSNTSGIGPALVGAVALALLSKF